MSISLVLHGYVVARGRANAAENPNSAWNRQAIDNILKLSNSINALSVDLLQSGFNFGNLFQSSEISVLRNIWIESNKSLRPKMKSMLLSMRAESGSLQGTIIVEKIDFLISKANEQSLEEHQLLRQILDGAVAIIDLSTESAKRFVSLEPASVTRADVSRLISEAADSRTLLRQKCQGVAAIQERPLQPADIKTKKHEQVSEYDLFSDPAYLPVTIKAQD